MLGNQLLHRHSDPESLPSTLCFPRWRTKGESVTKGTAGGVSPKETVLDPGTTRSHRPERTSPAPSVPSVIRVQISDLG